MTPVDHRTGIDAKTLAAIDAAAAEGAARGPRWQDLPPDVQRLLRAVFNPQPPQRQADVA